VPTTRLRITLRDVQPAVTRVLDVPASTTLPELHDLLQVALGWTDSHLHQFVDGDRRWAALNDWSEDELDESTVSLKALPKTFQYDYDFGDGWEHDIVVLGVGGDQPGLVEGEGACPPEDCGGVPGFEELLQVLANPKHPEHEHMRSWSAHHRFAFDLAATQALVQAVLGAVPEPVRAFLDVIGPGLKLTQAGKLPPATVAALLERCPLWDRARGAVREDNVLGAGELRELLKKAGVVRLSRGVLSPTKAAADDREIVRRLRRLYPEGEFDTILVTNALAVLAAAGPLERSELLDRVLPMMGDRWAVNGQPLDRVSLERVWYQVRWPMIALDLIADSFRAPSVLGPSGLTLLPRAAALADILTREGTLDGA
jgi:hypothetical protein